jgi:hypothetical protein
MKFQQLFFSDVSFDSFLEFTPMKIGAKKRIRRKYLG